MTMNKEKYEAYMKYLRGEATLTAEQQEQEFRRRRNIREYEYYIEDTLDEISEEENYWREQQW